MTNGMIYVNDLPFSQFASANQVGFQNLAEEARARASYAESLASKVIDALSAKVTVQEMALGLSGAGLEVSLGELDVAPASHSKLGGKVGFPLDKWGMTVAWSRDAFIAKTAADALREIDQVTITHNSNLLNAVSHAILNNDNYTRVDTFGNGGSIACKRLYNADGGPIPDSPAGVSFDGAVHDHYIARVGALARTDITAILSTVTEHGLSKGLSLFLNSTDAAAVAALNFDGGTNKTGFVSVLPSGINVPSTVATANGALDAGDKENRLLGYWVDANGATPTYVASWCPANYLVAAVTAEPLKVLGMRQRPDVQGLNLVAVEDNYPTHVLRYEAFLGMGVMNRAGAACLYIGGATTWVDPTFTSIPKYGNAGSNI